jgi:glycosyltransferase involved in cell wall biosynthesis
VLHVITGLGVGGAESMLASLVGAKPPELEQRIVSLVGGGFHTLEVRKRGTPVVELAFDSPSRALMNVWSLVDIVRKMRPHVVQGWMYHGNLAALCAVRLAGLQCQTTVAWGIRCSDRVGESLQLRAVIRAGISLSRFADVIVANSQAGLDFHRSYGYRCREMLVVQNGIDTSRFRSDPATRARLRQELGIGSGEVVLAHVARVHPMKDHAMLLDIAWRLPHVTVLAVGAGTESLTNLPNLRRLGRREDVPGILAAADIIVSTSAYGEGFSNAIAEGMAAGLVPVATDVGDAREIVGGVGSIVQRRAPAKMAAALEALAALPREELARKGALARDRVETFFSLRTSLRNFTQLYVRLGGSESSSCVE